MTSLDVQFKPFSYIIGEQFSIMKSIIFLASFSVIFSSILPQVNSQDINCYSCGYREDVATGKRTKLDEPGETVAFCGEDNIADNPDVPTEMAPPVSRQLLCLYSYFNYNFGLVVICFENNYV